jgi:hypothetical protein
VRQLGQIPPLPASTGESVGARDGRGRRRARSRPAVDDPVTSSSPPHGADGGDRRSVIAACRWPAAIVARRPAPRLMLRIVTRPPLPDGSMSVRHGAPHRTIDNAQLKFARLRRHDLSRPAQRSTKKRPTRRTRTPGSSSSGATDLTALIHSESWRAPQLCPATLCTFLGELPSP